MAEDEANEVPMSEWVVFPQNDHPDLDGPEITYLHEDGKSVIGTGNRVIGTVNEDGTMTPISEIEQSEGD